ncbi:MAG: prolyl oligopeptidase family serine peptidase, partial [Armatimonadota bacterium]
VLTDMLTKPEDMTVMPNTRRMSFIAEEPDDKRTRDRKEKGDDAKVASDSGKPHRIYSACPRTGNVRPESPDDMTIWSYSWIDHKNVAVVHTSAPRMGKAYLEPAIGVLCVDDGEVEDFGVELTFPDKLTVSPDGTHLALIGNDRGVPFGAEAWMIDIDTGKARNLTPDLRGNVSAIEWTQQGNAIIIAVDEGVETGLYVISIESRQRERVCEDLPATIDEMAMADDGVTLAAIAQDVGESPEVWCANVESGEVQKLTSINIPGDELSLGECTARTYKSSDGMEIETLVTLPVGYEEGQRYPTIAVIHGGPWGRHHKEIRLGKRQLFANEGYVVLEVNYRGSSGYGLDFMMANVGDWMGMDFEDHLAGLDMLIEEGIADPDRLGIYGASYGGYAATWAITQTDRFKAAVSRCGIMDLYSLYAQSDEGPLVKVYFGTTPYSDPEAYRSRSPLHFVENVNTPILLLHGEDDAVVDIGQSIQMHSALKHFGVETELITYPREGHRFTEPLHEADLRERVLAWLDKYLKD